MWTAVWGGSAVHHYSPGGRLNEIVELPVPNVSACTLGGEDLTTLFVTTSSQGMTGASGGPAGAVFRAQVGVAGQPVREFAG